MKKAMIMILDGFGINEIHEANAVYMAKTPNLDMLRENYPTTYGNASGEYVGLPDGQMGNSEVGHLNIGAGRIIYQALTRITKSIKDGDFFEKEEFLKAVKNCKENDSALHLYGLLSDGGVHSHNTHLYALLELAKREDLEKVYVHAFLDGRDTPPRSAVKYLAELEEKINEIGVGKIATISGRYYAMDRDNRWERVKLAYEALVNGKGEFASTSDEAINNSYNNDVNDEFVLPTVIDKDGVIKENDSIIFFNFRPDRARELTRAIVDEEFNGFERSYFKTVYVGFTEYDVTIKNKLVAYKPENYKNTLGEYLSSKGLKQLRIAETEKYAHVTFFFNGGVEAPNEGEDRVLINSPKVATYDMQPEMSIYEVTDKLIENMDSDKYDFTVVNFANPDMVGHTGKLDAAINALEAVDKCVKKVYDKALEKDIAIFLCADHGNCEQMENYEDHSPHTAHTTNVVPFTLINYKENITIRENGKLADIAPTMLEVMGIEIPGEMEGRSLIEN
jgi:2,3-bisphosphoglycerate-independent phosphoglycerate mutase